MAHNHCPAFWENVPCPLTEEECQEQHVHHGPEECEEYLARLELEGESLS